MLAGPFVGLALPLLPAQILWINLLTHGLPGVALGSEPADPDAMHRPPRPPQQTSSAPACGHVSFDCRSLSRRCASASACGSAHRRALADGAVPSKTN